MPTVGILEFRLDPFDVPIAKIAPEKLISTLRGLVKPIVRQCVVYGLDGYCQACKQPSIHQRDTSIYCIRGLSAHFRRCQCVKRHATLLELIEIHEQKPRPVPDLIRKIASPFPLAVRPTNIFPRSPP